MSTTQVSCLVMSDSKRKIDPANELKNCYFNSVSQETLINGFYKLKKQCSSLITYHAQFFSACKQQLYTFLERVQNRKHRVKGKRVRAMR
jgi:hypothetical protein